VEPSIAVFIAGIIGAVVGAVVVLQAPEIVGRRSANIAALEILIVGHDDAGKTSFLNFLRHNEFADERVTRDTLEVSRQGAFEVVRPGEIDLPVKRILDIPGPLDPGEQLELVRREAPSTLLIMISADNPTASGWLRDFVTGLRVLLSKDGRLASKLISISVVLNKMDLIGEYACGERLDEMVNIVDTALEPLLMSNVRSIAVLPCTLLSSKGGKKAANRILATIINAAKRNRRLVPK
jgi:GTPase SAR1 family protein